MCVPSLAPAGLIGKLLYSLTTFNIFALELGLDKIWASWVYKWFSDSFVAIVWFYVLGWFSIVIYIGVWAPVPFLCLACLWEDAYPGNDSNESAEFLFSSLQSGLDVPDVSNDAYPLFDFGCITLYFFWVPKTC